MIFVTGAAGFIGSNFVLDWLNLYNEDVLSFDKLTYAGNRENLISLENHNQHTFVQGDICDFSFVLQLFKGKKPRAIIHFAAESHVDRSIYYPEAFIQTNVMGTLQLLKAAHTYWEHLEEKEKKNFRFLHVSTDEVYGTLTEKDPPFHENNRYEPNNPYSASKAASDHLVRSFHHTYGLPVLTTHCSNNYGPYQFPEKLIPLMIRHMLKGQPLPIYGEGKNIRDWLYVKDHCAAIRTILEKGHRGETYNIGGYNEKTNLEVVHTLCKILDILRPSKSGKSYRELITFIKDRPGHDLRYAINASKLEHTLGWKPIESFETGIYKTVQWYLENEGWVDRIMKGEYLFSFNHTVMATD